MHIIKCNIKNTKLKRVELATCGTKSTTTIKWQFAIAECQNVVHLLYSFRFVSCCYRAMHYSAKRGIEIACPTSVCLSVCLSVCNVDGSGPYRLEILETKRTTKIGQSLRSSKPEDHPPTPRGTWENLGETRGGVGKSGVLEHKSSNISETRKDRGKVTTEGL